MTEAPTLDRDQLVTVHDILWSWSLGHIPKADAISMMELDDELELYEAALANDVPVPGEASDLETSSRLLIS